MRIPTIQGFNPCKISPDALSLPRFRIVEHHYREHSRKKHRGNSVEKIIAYSHKKNDYFLRRIAIIYTSVPMTLRARYAMRIFWCRGIKLMLSQAVRLHIEKRERPPFLQRMSAME